MRHIAMTGFLALGLATSAQAADFGGTPATFDWNGFYAGAQVGHTWSDAELVFHIVPDYAPLDPEGIFGGAYAGYNIVTQSGFVFGAEIDIAASGADSSGVDAYRASDGSAIGLYAFDTEINWTGAARLRAGYAFDRLLVYAAGGLAIADVTVTEEDLDEDYTYTGWTVGAGLDYAVTDNLLVRAEYRYSDFGDEGYRGIDWTWFDVDLKTHDVRAGIAYKF